MLLAGATPWATADPPPVAQFYQQHCASCHGASGRNPQLQKIFPDMPDFTNAPWQAAHTKADLSESILNGQDAMPAYKGDLGGLTAGQLVEYVRTFANQAPAGASKATAPSDPKGSAPGDPPRAPAADPTPVAQFYQQHCASCHGANGRNPQLQKIFPDMPDFTNAPWQAAHTKADLSESILNGQDAMPAYKGDLGGLTAGQLVEYLRTFARPAKSQ